MSGVDSVWLRAVARAGVFTVLGAGLLIVAPISWVGASGLGRAETVGVARSLSATLTSALGAVTLASLPALLTAVSLSELLGPSGRERGRRFFELAAATPAAVYGLWGATWLGGVAPRVSATLVLAAMALPTITLLAMRAFSKVPEGLRETSAALGASPWHTAWRGVVPAAWRGLVSAAGLGFLRAIGESLAVSMVTTRVDEPLAARIVRLSTLTHTESEWQTLSALTLVLLLLTASVAMLSRRSTRPDRSGASAPGASP